MVAVAATLTIIGAAEGSWYRNVDLRYKHSFANANSGLSFGTFQFDMSTNQQGRDGLAGILKSAVAAKIIDQATSGRILADASKKNAKAFMKLADVTTVDKLLALPASKLTINNLDAQRAATEGLQVETMISAAAALWRAKGVTGAGIFTPGQPNYTHLYGYLLANLNRFPGNKPTFQSWLGGQKVVTAGGPPGGFQLTGAPSIDQMHAFFRSLKIWDGTQGVYQNLRDRLDPVLPPPTAEGGVDKSHIAYKICVSGIPLSQAEALLSYRPLSGSLLFTSPQLERSLKQRFFMSSYISEADYVAVIAAMRKQLPALPTNDFLNTIGSAKIEARKYPTRFRF